MEPSPQPLTPALTPKGRGGGEVRAFRARYVFPVASPAIRDGVVVVNQTEYRILEVGHHTDLPIEDLGDVALLPGLVNAHTHLEFSALAEPISAEGTFADWIRRVVAYRRGLAGLEGGVAAAVAQGLRESQAASVRTLGEIATPGWPRPEIEASHLDITVFAELLGLGSVRLEANQALAQEHLTLAQQGTNWRAGLSPHAPYTVHQQLFASAVERAAAAHVPVAFHLAETREELQLLADGTGPLRELLDQFGVWEAGAIAPGSRPLDYLKQLAVVDRALVIHGNYLAADEIALLAEKRDRMTVIYCPRTHEHFRHDPHPLEKLLAAGARVALGTDSRASNPDLNLLEEIRTVVRRHPGVSPQQALAMGTLAGAEALGLAHQTGTLAVGKRADLAMVPISGREVQDPHELLLEAP